MDSLDPADVMNFYSPQPNLSPLREEGSFSFLEPPPLAEKGGFVNEVDHHAKQGFFLPFLRNRIRDLAQNAPRPIPKRVGRWETHATLEGEKRVGPLYGQRSRKDAYPSPMGLNLHTQSTRRFCSWKREARKG